MVSTNTLRLLFLTPESRHPQPTVPSVHGRCFYATKSLSLSRIVRSASGPPKPLFHAGPHLAPHPLWPPQTGTLLNSGSREPAAWRAPTWEPAGEAATQRSPGPPTSHSTALSSAPRSLQGDLTLWTPTFLGEGKREGSRQKGRAKRVVGPEGVLPGVGTLQVPAAGAGSRKGCGTGLPWLAERAPSKHGARVRSGRAGLGRAGV